VGSPNYDRLSRIDDLVVGAMIEQCVETGLFVGKIIGKLGVHSQGATRGELEDNLREVLEMICEGS
jgi:predicted RNase H-like HicB family nuclease